MSSQEDCQKARELATSPFYLTQSVCEIVASLITVVLVVLAGNYSRGIKVFSSNTKVVIYAHFLFVCVFCSYAMSTSIIRFQESFTHGNELCYFIVAAKDCMLSYVIYVACIGGMVFTQTLLSLDYWISNFCEGFYESYKRFLSRISLVASLLCPVGLTFFMVKTFEDFTSKWMCIGLPSSFTMIFYIIVAALIFPSDILLIYFNTRLNMAPKHPEAPAYFNYFLGKRLKTKIAATFSIKFRCINIAHMVAFMTFAFGSEAFNTIAYSKAAPYIVYPTEIVLAYLLIEQIFFVYYFKKMKNLVTVTPIMSNQMSNTVQSTTTATYSMGQLANSTASGFSINSQFDAMSRHHFQELNRSWNL